LVIIVDSGPLFRGVDLDTRVDLHDIGQTTHVVVVAVRHNAAALRARMSGFTTRVEEDRFAAKLD
jgi:hypothetical protein